MDKLKAYRESLTQEDKDNLLKMAQAARKVKAEERDANAHLLKTEYMDENYWRELASKYKIRMPHINDKATTSVIRKYLKKANVSVDVFNEHYTSMKYFLKNNPKWNAFATVGIIMEMKE